MSKLIFALALALPCIALADDVPPLLEPDGFSRAGIQEVYKTLTPAMCVLRYSLEITNPSTGEVNRRAGHSLGLIVAPDGLILAHGHLLLENRRPKNIKVTIGDDRDTEYNAVILKKPDDINVTFFRIETSEALDLPYVHFTEDTELELGESVLLFGLLGSHWTMPGAFRCAGSTTGIWLPGRNLFCFAGFASATKSIKSAFTPQ